MSSMFAPSCRRWAWQPVQPSRRAFSTGATVRASYYAAKPSQPARAAASPNTPSAKTAAASPSPSVTPPKAAPANPLQSSHAQGGSNSSSSSSTSGAASAPASPLEPSSSSLASLEATDWSSSFSGLGSQPFEARIAETLLAPIDPSDVEIKPDGIIFLPEIKYRRTLNRAFGPGGWGLAPRGPEKVEGKTVSREYALVCLGQLVAIARGENDFFDPSGVATATEGCKSNALMRCCKDLGIASELWDPKFIREFKAKHAVAVFASNTTNNQKKRMWRRKDDPPFGYPWKEG